MTGSCRRRRGRGSSVECTNTVQVPSHMQEELLWKVHYPSLKVTLWQSPWKVCSSLRSVSVTQCRGEHKWLLRYGAQRCWATSSCLTCSLLSIGAEWRSAQRCHLSLLTFSDLLAGCTLNNRQEVKGQRPNLRAGVLTPPDDWHSSIKCHLPCQPVDTASIWMDTHPLEVKRTLPE